ncbi:MAG: ABC transporter permease [Bacteroidota bacterium]
MNTNNASIGNLLTAEYQKLKNSPTLYLMLLSGLLVVLIISLVSMLDVHTLVLMDENPWKRYLSRATSAFSIFVLGPISILLVSALIYIEQQASANKMLYTLPVSRGRLYFIKLFVLLSLIMMSILIFSFALLISGHIVGYYYPEFEMGYYAPDYQLIWANLQKSMLAVLALVGFQYLLSLYFNNFIFPLAIGLMSFIAGFLLTASDVKEVQYLPHAYPVMVRDYGMIRSDFLKEIWAAGTVLNPVEQWSIGLFLLFSLLAYWYETRRNIV